jgi:hypothetical protein
MREHKRSVRTTPSVKKGLIVVNFGEKHESTDQAVRSLKCPSVNVQYTGIRGRV